jgi:hypothetical protein
VADFQSIQKFLDSPDTVGFIVRGSDEIDRLISENPEIVATQTLSGRYVVCYTTVENYPHVLDQLGSSYLSSIAMVLGPLGRPGLEAAGILPIQQQPYLSLRGRGVLIGFVDTGIDYTQQVFRYEDGTSKIRYLYDQSITGTPPEGFSSAQTTPTNKSIRRFNRKTLTMSYPPGTWPGTAHFWPPSRRGGNW